MDNTCLDKLKGHISFITRCVSQQDDWLKLQDDIPLTEYDTFVLLLNEEGILEADSDLLFYNSTNKIIMEVRGGQGSIPSNKEETVIGPMIADDHCHCGSLIENTRKQLDLGYYDEYEAVELWLDNIKPSVKQIIFGHFNYELFNGWKPKKTKNSLTFENIIVVVQDNEDKCICQDTRDMPITPFCDFVSAKMIRNDEGTWYYQPVWNPIENMQKFIEDKIHNL